MRRRDNRPGSGLIIAFAALGIILAGYAVIALGVFQ